MFKEKLVFSFEPVVRENAKAIDLKERQQVAPAAGEFDRGVS